MSYSYDDDDEEYGFNNLVDDLSEMRRQREAREAARALAVTDTGLSGLRKAITVEGSWRARDRDDEPLAKALSRPGPGFDQELSQLRKMQAEEDARLAATLKATQATRERTRVLQIEAHRDLVRWTIPTLLTKSISLLKAGKISALDVCRIQAETNALAAKWRL